MRKYVKRRLDDTKETYAARVRQHKDGALLMTAGMGVSELFLQDVREGNLLVRHRVNAKRHKKVMATNRSKYRRRMRKEFGR